MGLAEFFKKNKKNNKQEIDNKNQINENINKDSSSSIAINFENLHEFMTYVATHPNENVVWINDYCNYVKEGSLLNEQGNFIEAIHVLQKAIDLRSDGIEARFEIIYSYQKLNDLNKAYSILLSMAADLKDVKQKAKFYRELGYLYTEVKNYKTAVACYLYSKNFEDHPTVANELAYIYHFSGSINIENPVSVLEENKLPVIR